MAGKNLGYAARRSPPARRRPLWRDLAVLLLLAAVLTVVIKAFGVEAFRIPSGSMQDTRRVGDRVLVNKLVYRVRGIDRGDLVGFSGQGSWDPLPSGPPPGLVPAAVRTVLQLYPGDRPSAQRFGLTVPPGRLWVMGDHRLNSSDSRYHGDDPGDGTIPGQAVIGRVFLVVWPAAHFREVPIPATFAQRGLAAPSRRGLTPLPMAAGLAGMVPLVWACRRPTAHVPSDRR